MSLLSKSIHAEVSQKNIGELLSKLNISYKEIDLYILAFVHRSIVNEKGEILPEHNERLEFLGDAVLELIITSELYKNFPDKQEGELTDIRSALVRGRNLAKVAKKVEFDKYLYLGKGEELSGGRKNDYILANTVEAFIGALYLEGGITHAELFIIEHIYSTLDTIMEKRLYKDFKTLVQEYAQAEYEITPTYKVLEESGPDHNKDFQVGIYLNEEKIGQGNGTSKKKAQESAAENGYKNIFKPKDTGQQ